MTTKIFKTSLPIRLVTLLVMGFLLISPVSPARVSAADSTKSSDKSSSDNTDATDAVTGTVKDLTPKTDPAAGKEGDVVCNRDKCPLITKYVNPAITLLSALVGIVAVLAIIAGGIQVTTSTGDPQKSAAGKNHIRNALIGVVAYLFLFAFLQWIIPGGILQT